MSDYWAGLANCLIIGEHFTETDTHYIRNLIRNTVNRNQAANAP
jgi:hypothetical protein